jgi:hypothetical protein
MLRMTGSTPLHVESRPSMLSSHRIALQQHSGARLCFCQATGTQHDGADDEEHGA